MPLTDPKLCVFPAVKLENGTGKYVMIELINPETKKERIVIRHDIENEYHVEVAESTMREAEFRGVHAKILGGGRIKVQGLDTPTPTIFIYGYSVQFGRGDHEITQGFIQEAYPDAEVTWSNEGY